MTKILVVSGRMTMALVTLTLKTPITKCVICSEKASAAQESGSLSKSMFVYISDVVELVH
jgi:hypothetical protein